MRKLAPLLIFLLLNCRSQPPQIQPNVDQFFKVYGDLMTLTIADSLGMADRSALLDSALKLNHMSQAQFDTTLAYLERNPEAFIQALEAFEKKASGFDPANP